MENKKELKKDRQDKKESIKKIKEVVLWVIVAGVVGAGVFWIVTLPKVPQSEIISRNGVHWHSTLSILINGEKVDIPAGIGIGTVHSPTHTHETDGTIHLEYGGVVREDDTRLGEFFKVWGEDFSSTGIMGNINGEGGILKMMVNGVENTEFENYRMRDGDNIEIIFE